MAERDSMVVNIEAAGVDHTPPYGSVESAFRSSSPSSKVMESPELRRVVSQVKVPRFPGDAEGSSSSDDEQHDSRGLLQDEVLSTGYKSKKEQDLIYASLKASFEPPSAMGQRQISIERSSASEETQAGIGEELLGFSIKEESITEEAALAGKWLHRAICRRRKYALHHKRNESCTPSPVVPKPSVDDLLPKSEYTFKMQKGVFRIFANMEDEMAGRDLQDVVPIMDFCRDLRVTLRTVTSAPIKTFCHRRLHLLEAKFRVYILLNEEAERRATMQVPKRDFYNVRKVDTHVHHSSCMHQKHLLRFIRKKMRTEGEEHVLRREGQLLTLTEVFKSLSMSPDDLNLDTLDVHADRSLFHRFDKFNLKYNPFGQSRLREVFLKMDNYLEGRYLAEITKEVFNDLEENKYQQAEYRISIYGRNPHEFSKLARWVVTFDLFSPNVRWLIQVPRLAHLMLEQRSITTLEEMFDNIFRPLFAVTVDPSVDPPLHALLKTVVGFDSVDDESLPERKRLNHDFDASEWKSTESVPYSHYCYFMWANLNSLNRLRLERGLNTFTFRPHAGEAGDIDHLATAFLLADNVSHGVMLRKSPVLQYLYYVEQIGLAMSPMSNNSLFVNYTANPFAMFFKRGLNVSLSTDDPLQFHLTKEPLIEEYGLAKQMWHLSVTDMCEIASNSVKQSGFEDAIKAYWLGGAYYKQGVEGNSILRSNVPDIRVAFRQGILDKERAWLLGCAKESAACDAGAVDQGVSLRSSSSTVQQEVYPSVSAWIAAAHRTRKEAKEASFK